MAAQGLKCYKQNCSQKPKYFCCSPEEPACMKCSKQTCIKCRKTKVTPLKLLAKKQHNSQILNCKRCNKTTENNYTSFQCQHRLCMKCTAYRVCEYIRFKKWDEKALESIQKSIKCQCESQKLCDITDFLQKYCFCCGANLDNPITLKHNLKIRNTCKNRIKLDIGSEDQEKKSLLDKQQLEDLFLRCKVCLAVTENKNTCKKCPEYQLKEQQSLKKSSESLLLEPMQKKEKAQTIEDNPNSNKGIEKNSFRKQQFSNQLRQKSKENKEKQTKIKLYKDKNSKDSQKTSQDYGNIKVECSKCFKQQFFQVIMVLNNKKLCLDCNKENKKNQQDEVKKRPQRALKCTLCHRSIHNSQRSQSQNSLILCQQCHSSNQKLWKKYEGKKIEYFQSTTDNDEEKQPQKYQNIRSQSNKKSKQFGSEKQTPEKSVYRCISCKKQSKYSLTKTISQELGGYLCQYCVFLSKNFVGKSSDSQKDRKRQERTKQYQIQKQNFKKKCHKEYFQPFNQHLTMPAINQAAQGNLADRTLLATILKETPDEVELIISCQRVISCYKCGYFGQEQLWSESEIGKVCMTCFVGLILQNK